MDSLEAANNLFYLSVEAQIEKEEALLDLILKKARG